ncbi:RNA-binding cell elongation regulator Jag/EloR [Levilactobacillus bambusae]|uniref:RNA-binding protein KhpB n=1 Tax=Levilactobacillus bambusae TaxID=2024736 RepID=A0A2V1MZW1_9LACO|nr:RNA-binding cell elongation regulator Jag/EloR [Levilactobacillus bambusae]PWG00529.1 RNA-binding protein [Levilactobacillus bambusae]
MTRFKGETVEAAVQKGLADFATQRENVKITVVSEPKRGFLGFGKRPAEVEITLISAPQSEVAPALTTSDRAPETITQPGAPKEADQTLSEATQQVTKITGAATEVTAYLTDIISHLGIPVDLTDQTTHRHIKVDIQTPQEGLLIGKHGRTINALQTLAQMYLNHHRASHFTVELDIAGYRERREQTLEQLADRTARRAVADGKPVYLDPMPSFERKVIHATLAENEFVTTYSAGREPRRSVVVAPR